MSIPTRFVVTTYNIWAENRWPDREAALRAYLKMAPTDILALQELRQSTRDLIDEALPTHKRVDDAFEGWTREGNLYWRDSLFELVAYGAEDMPALSKLDPLRRLFWVRLRLRSTGATLLVSTAHYTYQGHPQERATGQSPRIAQSTQTLENLNRLAAPDEAIIFMGDLNDAGHSLRPLREGGFSHSFASLGILPQVTHPAVPSLAQGRTAQVLDWQFHRGPLSVLSSEVRDFFEGDLPPSDHKPVIVTYGMGD